MTDYPEVVAKDILDLLESKGMLPPTFQRKETHPAYNNNYEVAGGFTQIYHRNIWEPEDD